MSEPIKTGMGMKTLKVELYDRVIASLRTSPEKWRLGSWNDWITDGKYIVKVPTGILDYCCIHYGKLQFDYGPIRSIILGHLSSRIHRRLVHQQLERMLSHD